MMLEQILSVLSTVHSVLQLSEVTIILMRYSGSATKFEVSLTVSVTWEKEREVGEPQLNKAERVFCSAENCVLL